MAFRQNEKKKTTRHIELALVHVHQQLDDEGKRITNSREYKIAISTIDNQQL